MAKKAATKKAATKKVDELPAKSSRPTGPVVR